MGVMEQPCERDWTCKTLRRSKIGKHFEKLLSRATCWGILFSLCCPDTLFISRTSCQEVTSDCAEQGWWDPGQGHGAAGEGWWATGGEVAALQSQWHWSRRFFFGRGLALLCASNLIQSVFLPPFFPLLPFFLLCSLSLPINIFWPLVNVPGVGIP